MRGKEFSELSPSEQKERVGEVRRILKTVVEHHIVKGTAVEFHGRVILSRAQYLEGKYPDAREYALFNLLTANSPESDYVYSKFDFPGDDSVEKFIRDLADELGIEQ